MAHLVCRSMEAVRYILTPESSPEPDGRLSVSINREPLKKRLLGYAKIAFWLLVSIFFSLALGQLN